MKRIMMLLLCGVIVATASAAVDEIQTFTGNPGDPLPAGWWDYNANTDYDASGTALNLDATISTDSHWIGAAAFGPGDFTVDIQFDNVSLGGQFEELYYKVIDDDGGSTQFGFKTWAGGLYVENLTWDVVLGWQSGQSTLVATLPSAVTQLDMQIAYTANTAAAGGVMSMSYDLGDGLGMVAALDAPVNIDATAGRYGGVWTASYQDYAIYGGYEHCAGASLQADLDYYEMTAVPEPATMALLGLGGLLLRRKR